MLLSLAFVIAAIVFPADQPARLPRPPYLVEPVSDDEEWLQFTVNNTPEASPSRATVGRLHKLWRTQLPEGADGSPRICVACRPGSATATC